MSGMDDLMQEPGVEMYHKPCNGGGCEACHQTGAVEITDEFKRLTDRADDAEQRITDALAVPLNTMYRNGERDALYRILDILQGKS